MAANKIARRAAVANLFTPRTPITRSQHLAGRHSQISRVLESVFQNGAHAIIYGERGVGKTSLARCISDIISSATATATKPIVAPRVNCDGTDDYDSVWRKVFSQVDLQIEKAGFGLSRQPTRRRINLADQLQGVEIVPHIVLDEFRRLGSDAILVVILDEFDRLTGGDVTRHVADTIKSLSDNDIPATVVVVGVGDSVTQLVKGHESIGRHLIEVLMPRMSRAEQTEILNTRLPEIPLSINDRSLDLIATFARGLPFYVHLIGQKAALAAINNDADEITEPLVAIALKEAIADSEQSMKQAYYNATTTIKKSHYRETLAACALARCDEFGYFTPTNVREPLVRILKKNVEVGQFNDRLKEFASPRRGRILEFAGEKYRPRYRFRDPMMEPYILMKSVDDGLVSIGDLTADG